MFTVEGTRDYRTVHRLPHLLERVQMDKNVGNEWRRVHGGVNVCFGVSPNFFFLLFGGGLG